MRAQPNSQGPEDKQETLTSASKHARQARMPNDHDPLASHHTHRPPACIAPHRTARPHHPLAWPHSITHAHTSLFSRYTTMDQSIGVVTHIDKSKISNR